jgi:AraC family transcriptional regulator
MPLPTHGDRKYHSSEQLGIAAEWDSLRVERRQIGSGVQNCVVHECTELVYILAGNARVRRKGDGQTQEGMALPGTSWLVPVGTYESLLELEGSTECLHIYLPATLLERSTLADYELDPDRIRLSYVGGLADPTLAHIGSLLNGLLKREMRPLDRMLADGLRTTLAAHLIRNYSVESRLPPERPMPLSEKRLRRVLDLIESRLTENILLEDLASEACLSPYHFSRMFRAATGSSPHRYLIERRVQMAKKLIACGKSALAQIALDAGFGSQSNFTRVFRRITGMTPGQYREQCGRASSAHNFARIENHLATESP